MQVRSIKSERCATDLKMDKTETEANINSLQKKGIRTWYRYLLRTPPSYAIVKKWVVEFKQKKGQRRRWPSVRLFKNLNHCWTNCSRIALDERRLIVQQIAKSIGISSDLIHTVLTGRCAGCLQGRSQKCWHLSPSRKGLTFPEHIGLASGLTLRTSNY